MNHTIAREFHFFSLLKFALPTMIMMVFMSLYTIVDGIFVSRFVGTNALSATNIVYPAINLVIGLAVMLATGGSAEIARKMGEGKLEEAKRNFSLVVLTGVVLGIIIAVVGLVFISPICYALGATGQLIGDCRDYLSILLLFAPASILQMLFQTFFVTAGKPMIGLALTISAGVTNMVFDYIFIVPFGMGVTGAALATAMGYLIPAVCGVLYCVSHKNALHFSKPKFEIRLLVKSCSNGSSEMVSNVSSAVITFLFNIIMIRLLGEDGVAAITIVLYAQFLLTALYLGFSMGVAPVISYHYGSDNRDQLRLIFKYCLVFVTTSSLLVYLLALLSNTTIVGIFSPKGSEVYRIAVRGFFLFAFTYLFSGTNLYASSMFTAFSNGKVSAAISFLRTFVFIILGLLALPQLLGVDGVWLAVPIAEFLTVLISVFFFVRYRKQYHYGR